MTLPYGGGPLGGGGYGGGGTITIVSATVVARNEVSVLTNVPALVDDPWGFNSATNFSNWRIAAIDPTITIGDDVSVPDGEVVPTRFPTVVLVNKPEDAERVDLRLLLDVNVELGVRYQLDVLQLVGELGETFAGTSTFEVIGVDKPRTPTVGQREPREPLRDLDTLTDAGAFAVDPSGDIAIHSGVDSLRKRLFRRILSDPGAWAHAPSYGVGVRVNAKIGQGSMQSLSNNISRQALLEPDVSHASTTVTVDTGRGIVNVFLAVQRTDNTEQSLEFELPATGT